MDYQTSSRQQRKQPSNNSPSTSSSPRQNLPTTTVSPALRFFTAVAKSSTPYESPYAQGKDQHPQPPPTAASCASTTATYFDSTLSAPSPVRTSTSAYSSSSHGSFLSIPASSPQPRASSPGTMSASRKMSAVSVAFDFEFVDLSGGVLVCG